MMKQLLMLFLLLSPVIHAGEVSIVEVSVECPGSCTFEVTLEHGDQGWHHYANQWDVVTLDGKLLKSRVLYHPHENEQPFTRSLSCVLISQDIKQVKIRAHDLVHGYSDQEFIVELPGRN